VYDLLVSLDWEVLPPEADHTKLPGFLPQWPYGQDFDQINLAFNDKYPASQVDKDDVSLMVVWVGGRLPVKVGTAGDETES
jgi:hypothetical protein